MEKFKKWLPLILAVLVTCCALCACEKDGSSSKSKSSYTGRYELERLETEGVTVDKRDFAESDLADMQYILLNKDGTGRVALASYGRYGPVQTKDFKYTYDEDTGKGYAYAEEDGFWFTVKRNTLNVETGDILWVFKK